MYIYDYFREYININILLFLCKQIKWMRGREKQNYQQRMSVYVYVREKRRKI